MEHRHATTTPSSSRTALVAGVALVAAVCLVGVPMAAMADEPVADTSAPETTLHMGATPASGWYRSAVAARLIATDAGDGVASISYVIGDGEPVTTPGADVSLSVRGEGVVALTYWATDLAGNDEPTRTHFFSIDTLAPEVEVTTPTLVERGAAVAFDYTCRDASSGVLSCAAALAPGSALPTDVVGEHTIDVVATDAAGWSSTQTFRYLVAPDLTSPAVSLATASVPASGWFTSGVGVQVVADDASGIASYHWSTTGAVALGGWTDGRESDPVFTIDVDGTTDVRVWALDAHGNRADAMARVRVDTTAPTVTAETDLPAFAPTVYRQGEHAVVHAACHDATSGIATCGVREAPGGVLATDVVGDHTVTLVATDVAGHRAETSYTYRVVAPVVPGGGVSDETPTPVTSAGDRAPELASTGIDAAGLALIGGLLAGAGVAALGMRRALRR